MNVSPTELPDVLLIQPRLFTDARGHFMETWSRERYAAAGVPADFVQDNLSLSRRGVLRGLHLQHPHGQGKLVQVVAGEVFDVAVDVRAGSPTFGRAVGLTLSAADGRQLYIPPGFAHGFCVTSDEAVFTYRCTEPYRPDAELGIIWNDPDLGIRWPPVDPQLSDKDARLPRLRDVDPARLPPYPPARR